MFFEEDDVHHFPLKCENGSDLSQFINTQKPETDLLTEPSVIKTSENLLNDSSPKSPQNDHADAFFSSLKLQSSQKLVLNDSSHLGKHGGIVTRSKIADSTKSSVSSITINKNVKKSKSVKKKKVRKLDDVGKHQGFWLLNDVAEESKEGQRKQLDQELFDGHVLYDIINEEKESEVDKFLQDENFTDSYLNLDLDDFHMNHRDGGKWKSIRTSPMLWLSPQWEPIDPKPSCSKWEDDWKAPPADHTRGKWLPSVGKATRYHCSPCDRSLASKEMFKKHLVSNLHLKRVLQENDLECNARNKLEVKEIKRKVSRPVRYGVEKPLGKKERCETCKMKVKKGRWGKHLVSYHHYRRFLFHSVVQVQQVLENMPYVVMQSPYQCSPCRFFCNTFAQFRAHWDVVKHGMLERGNALFWCRFCSFACPLAKDMVGHLDSESHREVIRAINGFVPIVIQLRTFHSCDLCGEQFLLNIQMRRHRLLAHGISQKSLVYSCNKCSFTGGSLKSLQSHKIRQHKRENGLYYCSLCDCHFNTPKSALLHRRSFQHKCAIREKISQTVNSDRKCQICGEIFPHLGLLKLHMAEKHPEKKSKCLRCGMTFVFAQELGRHSRLCRDNFPALVNGYREFGCDKCGYSAENSEGLLLHKSYHEKEQKCVICLKTFRLQKNLKNHIKSHSKDLGNNQEKTDDRDKLYTCGIGDCKEVFINHANRQAHRKQHNLTCQFCSYQAQNNALLKRHLLTHSETRLFQCSKCDFSARLSEHLKRHMRVHSGMKPYKCPHCAYSCNLLENLRKHVLGKKSHLGMKLYNCENCSFGTNSASEIKSHMSEKHQILSYNHLNGIYQG